MSNRASRVYEVVKVGRWFVRFLERISAGLHQARALSMYDSRNFLRKNRKSEVSDLARNVPISG